MSPWNQRFFVSPSKDNDRLHDFYRQYFDKPSGRRCAVAIPPERLKVLDPPNLASTLGFEFQRIPKESRVIPRRSRRREFSWDNRFSVMRSKDNRYIHPSEREYFDRPKTFDPPQFAFTQSLPKLPHACTYQAIRSSASVRSIESLRSTWRDQPKAK